MELFDYLMAKKGHNTHRDLFSYLLGKGTGGGGTYTTFSGVSLNISNTLQAKIKNIALEGNTSQDGDPTPDTPVPIKVVTGEQNVEISGKNLIPTQVNAWEQGSISVDGNVSSLTRIRIKKYYPIKNDVTYHVSVENEDYCFLNIWLYDKDNNYIGQYYNINKNINGATNLNIIIPSTTIPNLSYMRVVLRKQNNTSQININEIEVIKPQMELGTTKTSFEPYYTPQNYPLSLGNIELAGINDYKDYIFKNVAGSPYYNADLDLNGWYKYKNINKIILDGTESWIFDSKPSTPTPRTVIRSNIERHDKGIYFSNYFIYNSQTSNRIIINDNSIALYISLDNIIANIEETDSNSIRVQKMKSWLASNNTIVYYSLATPTYEKITDTTLISQLENINKARSYKGTTIIECTSENTDNETIVFSGDIKVTSVGLGNSLNTSLLSNNIQEEPNLDDVSEIEEPTEEYEEL